jgi:hypothetical protein
MAQCLGDYYATGDRFAFAVLALMRRSARQEQGA